MLDIDLCFLFLIIAYMVSCLRFFSYSVFILYGFTRFATYHVKWYSLHNLLCKLSTLRVGSPYGVKFQNIQIPSGIKKAAYWRLHFIARPSLKEIVFTYGALAPQVLLYFLKRKGNTSIYLHITGFL